MKLSSQFFVVLSMVVVGTVSIAAEPCLPGHADDLLGFGRYDMPACDGCAHSGNKLGGQCCDGIYRHSLGRNDDDYFASSPTGCFAKSYACTPGRGMCYPGLVCAGASPTCTLPTDNPEAHAASSLLTLSFTSSSNTKDGPAFVVVVVGLLGAALTKLYHSRHRGLLRRHQYNEVDATATRIDV